MIEKLKFYFSSIADGTKINGNDVFCIERLLPVQMINIYETPN